MTALYYEELEVDQTTKHGKHRVVLESDNQRFCDMTMNQQPLHLDAEFTANSRFGKRLVNGLYTMSLTVGLSVPDTTDGTIAAGLSYDDMSRPNPVFHGSTLRAQTTVLDRRETSGGGRGVVTMRAGAFNQDDDLVCEFGRAALSLKREFAADADDT